MNNNPQWFAELENVVPKTAYGESLSIYMIAYEAWKRGLEISFESTYLSKKSENFISYTISSNEKSESFNKNMSLSIPKSTLQIISSRLKTRRTLAKKDIPVVKSKIFNTLDPTLIQSEIRSFLFPIKLYVLNSSPSRGSSYIASDIQELNQILEESKDELEFNKLLIEEFTYINNYYAYIVNSKLVGVYNNVAPYVIGDGEKSILELLKEKNIILKQIPCDGTIEVQIDIEVEKTLSQQNYSLDSVLKPGETVVLDRGINKNISVDVTDSLPAQLKENLINVIQSIPDFPQGEIEFTYDKITEEYRVAAINSQIDIKNYLYPFEGNARDIPKAIIDYYFPETEKKYLSDDTPKFYFDYEIIENQIQNSRLSKVVIPEYPYEPNLTSKIITFRYSEEYGKIKKMIKDNFIKLNFNGELNMIEDDQLELIIAGNYQDMAYFYDFLQSKNSFKNIEMKDHPYGVRVGHLFNDKRSTKSKDIKKDRGQIAEYDQERTSLQKVSKKKDDKSRKVLAFLKRIIVKEGKQTK